MNHESAMESGATIAVADGMYCDYYKGDKKVGTRKSGSIGDAYQDALSYNHMVASPARRKR